VEAKEGPRAIRMFMCEQTWQAVCARECVDAGEFGCERRETLGLDTVLVHAAGVEIADLAGGGIAAGGGLLQDRAQLP
jgi:hypothetical protein